MIHQRLDFSSEDYDSKEVTNGSRYILDHLLVELHNFVHTTGCSKQEKNILLTEASLQWNLLIDHFLFKGDNYQKKIVSMLLNCIFLQEGRMLTAMALQKGLCNACTDEELSSVLLLIKDVEMWNMLYTDRQKKWCELSRHMQCTAFFFGRHGYIKLEICLKAFFDFCFVFL